MRKFRKEERLLKKIKKGRRSIISASVIVVCATQCISPTLAEEMNNMSGETFELHDVDITEVEESFAEAGENIDPDEWYEEGAEEDIVLDNVLVILKSETTDEEIADITNEIDGTLARNSTFLGTRLCTFDVEDSRKAAKKLLDYDAVLSAEPNTIMESQSYVSSSIPANSTEQWNFDTMHVDEAWDIIENHYQCQVNAAIIDFGYPNTEIASGNLAANVITEDAYDAARVEADYDGFDHTVTGYEAHNQTPPIAGYNASIYGNHATAVASILAGNSNQANGISGVGSGWKNHVARIVPINYCYNVGDDDEKAIGQSALASDAIDALGYAVEHDCRIVNMSFGSYLESTTFENACTLARGQGICLIASAGNDNSDNGSNHHYPSDYDSVISVIATDSDNGRVEFEGTDGQMHGSNYGGKAEGQSLLISAPGIGIPHLTNDTDHPVISNDWGTSYAAPEVSGVIALMLSVNPNLTPDEVEDILAETATDIYDNGYDDESGWGIVNAERAVREAAEEKANDRATDPTTLTNVTVSGCSPFPRYPDGRTITITTNDIDPYEQLRVEYGSSGGVRYGEYGENTMTFYMRDLEEGNNSIQICVEKRYRPTRDGHETAIKYSNLISKSVSKYHLCFPRNITATYDGTSHNINDVIFNLSSFSDGLTIKYGTTEGIYNLSSASRKNVGKQTYYYKISGSSLDKDYTGSFDIQINPATTYITGIKQSYFMENGSVTNRMVMIEWNKQKEQTDGYEIQYSTDQNFSNDVSTVTVSSSETTTATLENRLTPGDYYFRIRTYKAVGLQCYYSAWRSCEDRTKQWHLTVNKQGWLKEGGEWYYYKDGTKLTNGWAQDSIGWCYMDANGKIIKSKWIQSNGEWYYLKPNGYMAANEWAQDSIGWCYMDTNGKQTKSKWIQSDGEWYYLKPNGYMATNEWAQDSFGWCYMDANGKQTKNKWIIYNGDWYYLKANGYMAANEYSSDSSHTYWMGSDGKIARTVG